VPHLSPPLSLFPPPPLLLFKPALSSKLPLITVLFAGPDGCAAVPWLSPPPTHTPHYFPFFCFCTTPLHTGSDGGSPLSRLLPPQGSTGHRAAPAGLHTAQCTWRCTCGAGRGTGQGMWSIVIVLSNVCCLLAFVLGLTDCIRLNAPGGAPVELDIAPGKVCGLCPST
jgi:hypothetical protein